MEAITDNTLMNTLGTNPVFNAGGILSVFSSFGLWLGRTLEVASIDNIFTIILGIMSFTYLSMQIYLTFIRTRREKNKKSTGK